MLEIKHLSRIAILAAALISTGLAQAPSFDVASLKPVQPAPPYPVDLGNSLNGKLTLTNVTLAECLRFAYKIHTDGQIAGPDWIKSRDTLFSIVAKAPPETPRDTLRQMALTLLTERFKLAVHHEQRELPYMALVVDKKGSKLRVASDSTDDSGNDVSRGRIVVHKASIATLIVLLGRFTSETIEDQTELKGLFDVKLEWTPVNQRAPREIDLAATPDGTEGPTLFEALTEQLGLKLERRKGPMDVIVVDHAEKTPLAN